MHIDSMPCCARTWTVSLNQPSIFHVIINVYIVIILIEKTSFIQSYYVLAFVSYQMDARNLAIVFGPTLVRTMDESMITMVKDMSDQCRLVESIILHVSIRKLHRFNSISTTLCCLLKLIFREILTLCIMCQNFIQIEESEICLKYNLSSLNTLKEKVFRSFCLSLLTFNILCL